MIEVLGSIPGVTHTHTHTHTHTYTYITHRPLICTHHTHTTHMHTPHTHTPTHDLCQTLLIFSLSVEMNCTHVTDQLAGVPLLYLGRKGTVGRRVEALPGVADPVLCMPKA
jgi:YD repeat-containing protein